MTEVSEVIDLSADEIDTVAGGLLGGIIKSPIEPGTIPSGVAGWLPGDIPGASFDGGRFGFAAEFGSLLLLHGQISQTLMFDVLQQ
ncbi:MAG: hypothetical protein MUF73_02280 [Rhodobacteraceae bacterium]|nr:hypothetical protein [Paracoccaceae bacterium]